MSAVEFRIILAMLVVVVLAHVAYSAPRNPQLRANEATAQYGWIAGLSPKQRSALIAVLVAFVACGLLGLAGMFFFSKVAAIAFLVASALVEIGSRIAFRGGRKSPLEWALASLSTFGSVLVLYLVFFGAAKGLFE
jgi:hypothetical protein